MENWFLGKGNHEDHGAWVSGNRGRDCCNCAVYGPREQSATRPGGADLRLAMAQRSSRATVEVIGIQEGPCASFATEEAVVRTPVLESSDVYLLGQMFLLLDGWARADQDQPPGEYRRGTRNAR